MSWKKLLGVSLGIGAHLVYLLAQVVVQGILVTLQYRQLHTFVCPQAVEGCEELLGHWLLGAYIRRCVDHLGVSLETAVSMMPPRSLRAATYNVVFILKICVVLLHGRVDGLEGRYQVVEDGRSP